jgi:hypothetical protein
MNAYRFADYPSNSVVAAGVTVLVSAWFLVAAGAILTDPPSPYTQPSRAMPDRVATAGEPVQHRAGVPHVHYTVMVVGKRPAG